MIAIFQFINFGHNYHIYERKYTIQISSFSFCHVMYFHFLYVQISFTSLNKKIEKSFLSEMIKNDT